MQDEPPRPRAVEPRPPEYQLRLYIAGQSARSIAAISNLKAICEHHLGGRYAIEVVDLLEHPHLAKGDEILAMPTLVRRLPPPMRKIVGDLSNVDRVLLGLDIVKLGETAMNCRTLEIDDVAISDDEAAETLRAIRSGRVDAAVVNSASGHDVFTFRDPDQAYRALLEAMGEGAALLTRDGIITYHNPRFAELTTEPGAHSLRGKALRELMPVDAVASIDAMLERAQRGPARNEVALVTPDGGTLTVQLTASATSVADVDTLCLVVADLTEQRAQAALHREALVGMEARDRLISIAGHELRAPMQVLISELGVLLSQHAAATADQLNSLQRLGLQLAKLVANLLDLGLLGSNQLALSLEELDLADVVRAIAVRTDDPVRSGSPIVVDALSIRGHWDRLRLEQVVTNLLSNAVKYGLGRPIRVVVDGDEKMARLVVEDRGIGITRDAIARLFRPFERIGSVKTATGLGLGLYITAQIVKAHGGVVRVESDPSVGSRFIVELPRAGLSPTAP